jgi:hypothetical protein
MHRLAQCDACLVVLLETVRDSRARIALLLERRRAYRVHQIEALRRRLQELSLESPAVSLEKACKRVGLSRQRLVTLCPEESAAIVAHYDSSLRGHTMQKAVDLDRQVRPIVGKLHEEGKFPSVTRVRACLEGSAAHGWTALTAMIKAAISELNTRASDPRESNHACPHRSAGGKPVMVARAPSSLMFTS